MAISALSYVFFGRLRLICRRFGPYRSRLVADCPCWGPLSLYPLAVAALSYVPFVSVPRRAPLSSHPFQVFKLSHVPFGPRRGMSLRNLHFLAEMAPFKVQTSFLSRRPSFLRPRAPKTIISKRKWALEAPGFLFERLPLKLHPQRDARARSGIPPNAARGIPGPPHGTTNATLVPPSEPEGPRPKAPKWPWGHPKDPEGGPWPLGSPRGPLAPLGPLSTIGVGRMRSIGHRVRPGLEISEGHDAAGYPMGCQIGRLTRHET